MSYDDHEDLFSGDFDFVDEDELDESSADLLSSERGAPSDRDASEIDQEDSELDDLDDLKELEAGPEEEPDEQLHEDRSKDKRGTGHRKRAQETSTYDSFSGDKTEGVPDAQTKRDDQYNRDSDGRKESDPSDSSDSDSKPVAEDEPPKPPTDHVVHIYELGQFKRTIQREFTEEDAEAFATQYNLTAKAYNRKAIAVAREEEPATTTD